MELIKDLERQSTHAMFLAEMHGYLDPRDPLWHKLMFDRHLSDEKRNALENQIKELDKLVDGGIAQQ